MQKIGYVKLKKRCRSPHLFSRSGDETKGGITIDVEPYGTVEFFVIASAHNNLWVIFHITQDF